MLYLYAKPSLHAHTCDCAINIAKRGEVAPVHELHPFPPTWLAEACAHRLLDKQHREALVPRRCAHTSSKLAQY